MPVFEKKRPERRRKPRPATAALLFVLVALCATTITLTVVLAFAGPGTVRFGSHGASVRRKPIGGLAMGGYQPGSAGFHWGQVWDGERGDRSWRVSIGVGETQHAVYVW